MNINLPNILLSNHKKLYQIAFGLAIFTILYNIAEGLISTLLGFEDESLVLFGFGIDSFIEVISGIGIANMIISINQNPECKKTDFERTALKITGFSFYALVLGLLATGFYNMYSAHKPESTFWGVIIALVSIIVMLVLIYAKIKVGKKLNSDAILADAACTKVCIYMSITLLLSSLIYELTNYIYIDVIGAFFLSWFSFKEGRECFEKAKNNKHCSC